MKKTFSRIALMGWPLAGALILGSVSGALAQAPPPHIGGGGGVAPGTPMAPPPPPPPPPGAGDLQGGGMVPAGPAIPLPQTVPAMPGLPNNGGTGTLAAPKMGTLLRYRFHPNEVQKYLVKINIDGSVQMGATGTKQPIKQHMEMTITQKVKSVAADDTATLEETVSDLSMGMNGQTIPLPAQAQAQMEKPITLVMSPTGEVKSMTMPAGSPSNPMMGMSPTQGFQMQGLPDKAVNIGDTWRSNLVSAAAGMETHVLYTLSGLSPDGNLAAISQKIYIAFKPAKPTAGKAPAAGTAPMAGMNMTGLMTGTGLENFNVDAGQVESQHNNMHMNLSMTQAQGGMAINTDFDITTDMTRVNDAAPGDEPTTK